MGAPRKDGRPVYYDGSCNAGCLNPEALTQSLFRPKRSEAMRGQGDERVLEARPLLEGTERDHSAAGP